MRILVTGLCTLHWGRLEHGNVGNYYIIVPFFRELHRTFPGAEIVTTLQLTEEFCLKENITLLPLDYYYAWNENDLSNAYRDYAIAEIYNQTGQLVERSQFIDEIIKSDLVINFSGDMWGDNSASMGHKRFLVDLLKNRTAQLIGKPVAMIASSPGPVTEVETLDFAKLVYSNYLLVANREPESQIILKKAGFNMLHTVDFACPAFLFDSSCYPEQTAFSPIYEREGLIGGDRNNVGIIMSGYIMPDGEFNTWPRGDHEYIEYAEVVEYIVNTLGARVVLMSHSNGFELPPNFKRTHWRDYKINNQLWDVVKSRGIADMKHVHKIDSLYYPWEIHAIIGKLDMLFTGRVHAAVAGLAQKIPTVAIEYKNGPLSHKMHGFLKLAHLEEYVLPRHDFGIIPLVKKCYDNMDEIRNQLSQIIPEVQDRARAGFDALRPLVANSTKKD